MAIKEGGYLITGVRGEGKTLAAVAKIREYALAGRPIATNLDLFLEHLLPPDCDSIIYRLPDKPSIADFEALPPAYDVNYKSGDMNGLLVLDELGTWLNSRSWNDKSRLPMLNWLFLSRKLHWDIILLAQHHEMIDVQVRNTLCEHWVVSSRLDKQKIPYLAPILEFLGMNPFMPRVHRYFVFYGYDASVPPVDTWTYSGTDFYNGYNTNQLFIDSDNPKCRHIGLSTYLPASYLSGHRRVTQAQIALDALKKSYEVSPMAVKKTIDNSKHKAYMLIVFLVVFLAWRFFSPSNSFFGKSTQAAVAAQPIQTAAPAQPIQTAAPAQPIQTAAPAQPIQAFAPAHIETHDLYADLTYSARESRTFRLAGTVKNVKTGIEMYVAIDRDKHTRYVPASACRTDRYNQPYCVIDGEIVTLFTGSVDTVSVAPSSVPPVVSNTPSSVPRVVSNTPALSASDYVTNEKPTKKSDDL